MTARVLIGTHSGTFHCDEALACFLLKCLPRFSSAEILRSRNETDLNKCDIVVDVGAVYDPEKLKFDHHQRTFDLTLKSIQPDMPFETKLSSAGLVYAHFGREILQEIAKSRFDAKNGLDEKLLAVLYKKCYAEFVEEIDAIDNGIEQYDDAGKPRYSVSTLLSSRVSCLNPAWNDAEKNDDEQFQKAMQLTGSEFVDRFAYFYKSWWPARSIVAKAFEERSLVDDSGSIVFLEQPCPWKEHFFDLESEKEAVDSVKYCFFFDDRQKYFMIVAVPVKPKSFLNRAPLCEKWRGLREEELCKEARIEQCVFVHASGFCGANRTREGALEMMRKSLSIG